MLFNSLICFYAPGFAFGSAMSLYRNTLGDKRGTKTTPDQEMTLLQINRLSATDALLIIEGAEAKARELGLPACIAVTDESGFLIAFKRMDGGKPLSTTLAQDKAHTAAISHRTTQFYNERNIPGQLLFGIHTAAGGRFSTVGGGINVQVDGQLVGAVGVSGGAPEQDIACAEAGVAHFLKSLK